LEKLKGKHTTISRLQGKDDGFGTENKANISGNESFTIFFSFYTSEEQVCVLPHETNEF
jgi:hypothetical protein